MTAAADTTAMVPAQQQEGAAIEQRAPAARPQFVQGFDGIASEPFPEDARRVLAAAVDPRDVEIKPDGIVFLPGVAYRRILTKAFGAGGWALAPRSPARVMGNIVVYHGALFCLGRFVAEAVGECFYRENNPNMSYASCVEGAKTDALSRCCKDLGIATELWDANWREKWKAEYATSYRGKKWNAKAQREDDATLWKLKARVSNPHDLMAGAGGVAPAAPPQAGTTVPPSAPASAADVPPDDAGEVIGAHRNTDADTGEAATSEQKLAVIEQLKRLGWKAGFVKMWFASTFGLQISDARRAPDALSQKQADTCYYLLLAHGKPVYDKLLADEKAKGNVL